MKKHLNAKRLLTLLLIVSVTAMLAVPALADGAVLEPASVYEITVNGESLDALACIMVPARKVGEALGFTVTWLGNGQFTMDDGTMKTTVTWGEDSYLIAPSEGGTLGAASFSLGIPPYGVNGVSYVPLALFEALKGNEGGLYHYEDGKLVIEAEQKVELSAPVLGGWAFTASPELTEEQKAAFEKGLEKLLGVAYTPVACLGTQVVNGTNCCFLAQAKVVVPDAEAKYVLVYLNETTEGDVTVLNIADLPLNAEEGAEQPALGGWRYTASPEVTEEQKAAFDKAMETLAGVNYAPVACLGTQVVSGTNYCFLTQATVVYPGAEPSYKLVYVYSALDGSASVLNIADLDLASLRGE